MQGPSAVAFDNNGTLYFTDSGALGETTLGNPKGSVFYISGPESAQILRPLALECLAHPCGIAASARGQAVYVAEMMRNRVLRFAQRPAGVFHLSVFCQMSGGLGPSCLALDETTETLYVGKYDFSGTYGDLCATWAAPARRVWARRESHHARLWGHDRQRVVWRHCGTEHRRRARVEPLRDAVGGGDWHSDWVRSVPRAHERYHLANRLTNAHLPRFCRSSDGCLIVTEGSKGNLQKIPL